MVGRRRSSRAVSASSALRGGAVRGFERVERWWCRWLAFRLPGLENAGHIRQTSVPRPAPRSDADTDAVEKTDARNRPRLPPTSAATTYTSGRAGSAERYRAREPPEGLWVFDNYTSPRRLSSLADPHPRYQRGWTTPLVPNDPGLDSRDAGFQGVIDTNGPSPLPAHPMRGNAVERQGEPSPVHVRG
jgi:hypothetical protein